MSAERPSTAPKTHKCVFLAGFMGSGKSTVGALLAQRLGLEFVDLDARIEEKLGMPISQVFETRGERFFRQAEAAALAEAAGKGPCVVALGGGAFENPANRETVRRSGASVWLDLPWELAWERCGNDPRRPLAADKSAFRKLFRARLESYRLADFRIQVEGRGADQVVEAILRATQANFRP